jgi:hypothetical protein
LCIHVKPQTLLDFAVDEQQTKATETHTALSALTERHKNIADGKTQVRVHRPDGDSNPVSQTHRHARNQFGYGASDRLITLLQFAPQHCRYSRVLT